MTISIHVVNSRIFRAHLTFASFSSHAHLTIVLYPCAGTLYFALSLYGYFELCFMGTLHFVLFPYFVRPRCFLQGPYISRKGVYKKRGECSKLRFFVIPINYSLASSLASHPVAKNRHTNVILMNSLISDIGK